MYDQQDVVEKSILLVPTVCYVTCSFSVSAEAIMPMLFKQYIISEQLLRQQCLVDQSMFVY